jgi:hypothetical protein
MSGKKNTNNAGYKPQNIQAKDFKIENFDINHVYDQQTPYKQYSGLTQYKYPPKKGDDNSKVDKNTRMLSFLTDTIEIKKGGIPTVNKDQNRPTDNECDYFYLPLDEEHGGKGAPEVKRIFEEIDKKISDGMKDPNFVCFSDKSGANPKPVKGFSYYKTAKLCTPDENDESKNWTRSKIKFARKQEKPSDKKDNDEEKKDGAEEGEGEGHLDVKVVIKNEEGNMETRDVKTVAEMRNLLGYKCKARFLIDVMSFWIAKTPKDVDGVKKRDCGFKVRCKYIMIEELSEYGQNSSSAVDVQGLFSTGNANANDNDSDAEEETKTKPVETKPKAKHEDPVETKQSKKQKKDDSDASDASDKSDDSDSDASDDSEKSDKKKPKKEVAKKGSGKGKGKK